MDLRLVEYVTYLAISVGLTIWVGGTLYRGGRPFLVDVFKEEGLADSINHLLVVGFYLVNLGAAALLITAGTTLSSTADVVEAVVGKVGIVLLVLGGMHFTNLLVLHRLRRPARRAVQAQAPPGYPYPAPPQQP